MHMQFESLKLDERLQRAVVAAGYTEMTPIQEAAMPPCLAGRDLIGTAQTGTGKTAAFVLPILQALLDKPVKSGRTRALIVTPTRELAEQIHAAIKELGRYTKVRSATVYGGVGMAPQERALRQGVEIIVACPGRLLDHVGRGNAKLGNVEIFVLDEADRMLDMGFLPPVRRIAERLPQQRQTLLYSATFAPELKQLAAEIMQDPERIEMGLAAPAATVEHTLLPVESSQKTALLLHLLEKTDTNSVLIFTRTKHRADKVFAQIERYGYKATVLHSNRSQGQRQRSLDGFRSGEFQLLVATDIASRGLDVTSISHVINYDVPDCADAYIHRIGRTGRAERNGDALTLVTTEDRAVVRDIEKVLGEPIATRKVEGFDYDSPGVALTRAAVASASGSSYGGRASGSSGGGSGARSWSSGRGSRPMGRRR
jgi:ATP-dependent RNA helicase RhlE